MNSFEVNFDGIIGPTHHFGGHSYGNVASLDNKLQPSNPKAGALQGLQKMRLLHSLGIKQAVLPPHERPYIPMLRELGFNGSEEDIVHQVALFDLHLLYACSSSAFAWAANAATVSPSVDTKDHKVHFTAANLSSKFHRSIEAEFTEQLLKRIFYNQELFVHHSPLPRGQAFADEGAANHTRLQAKDTPPIHLFVYGTASLHHINQVPEKYPARQTLESVLAHMHRHALPVEDVFFAQQHPKAIDAGVFHNDVISVGHEDLLLCHETAFLDQAKVMEHLQKRSNGQLQIIEISDISLEEAVRTYLFNSQIVTLKEGKGLIVPQECMESTAVKALLKSLEGEVFKKIISVDLRESMRNGGGPACLRLRVLLNEQEWRSVHHGVIFTEELGTRLETWIHKHYRDRIELKDLSDPRLMQESQTALDELSQILFLPNLYSFQRKQ